MSSDEGNPENNNFVSQITDNPNAIVDLLRALILTLLSSLTESLATHKAKVSMIGLA